jgi:hypothetical protein
VPYGGGIGRIMKLGFQPLFTPVRAAFQVVANSQLELRASVRGRNTYFGRPIQEYCQAREMF